MNSFTSFGKVLSSSVSNIQSPRIQHNTISPQEPRKLHANKRPIKLRAARRARSISEVSSDDEDRAHIILKISSAIMYWARWERFDAAFHQKAHMDDKGNVFEFDYCLAHTPIPVQKAMTIRAARAAVDQQWNKLKLGSRQSQGQGGCCSRSANTKSAWSRCLSHEFYLLTHSEGAERLQTCKKTGGASWR